MYDCQFLLQEAVVTRLKKRPCCCSKKCWALFNWKSNSIKINSVKIQYYTWKVLKCHFRPRTWKKQWNIFFLRQECIFLPTAKIGIFSPRWWCKNINKNKEKIIFNWREILVSECHLGKTGLYVLFFLNWVHWLI